MRTAIPIDVGKPKELGLDSSEGEPISLASLYGPSSVGSDRAIGSTLADRYEEGEDYNGTP